MNARLPVVLLGIMKSGCAYVPLSYFHPPERIRSIIEDASAFLMISTKQPELLCSLV
ncbi:AMP-binding protein [Vibrio quintilis]|uniref:AMP-binding protein n=1 Tax=Vibrio quintilis TaxID=1117707 RepID=UPI0011611E5B